MYCASIYAGYRGIIGYERAYRCHREWRSSWDGSIRKVRTTKSKQVVYSLWYRRKGEESYRQSRGRCTLVAQCWTEEVSVSVLHQTELQQKLLFESDAFRGAQKAVTLRMHVTSTFFCTDQHCQKDASTQVRKIREIFPAVRQLSPSSAEGLVEKPTMQSGTRPM